MKSTLARASRPPLIHAREPEIPPNHVWATLTVTQQEQLVQTILMIGCELFVPWLENEVKYE